MKPGAVVDREVMLVYAVTPRGITRTFGVETGRALGGKRVQGALALLPGTHGFDIEVRPGRAFGFNEKTYPFGQDQARPGGSSLSSCPWGQTAAARYHWDGASFTK